MTWKIHIDDVQEQVQRWTWEGADYERYRRHISVALGNAAQSRHPFDVELTRLAPGRAPCPVHAHSATWEFFLIVSGRGEVHRDGQTHAVVAGDCFLQPAGTRHRLRNASDTEDLLFYVIANEPEACQTTKYLP